MTEAIDILMISVHHLYTPAVCSSERWLYQPCKARVAGLFDLLFMQ